MSGRLAIRYLFSWRHFDISSVLLFRRCVFLLNFNISNFSLVHKLQSFVNGLYPEVLLIIFHVIVYAMLFSDSSLIYFDN